MRKVLEDQLSQIQQEKNAARELKKKEAAELKDSIRQYEEEELQKWQQHKQQQGKTKKMYSEQVCYLAFMHPHRFVLRCALLCTFQAFTLSGLGLCSAVEAASTMLATVTA